MIIKRTCGEGTKCPEFVVVDYEVMSAINAFIVYLDGAFTVSLRVDQGERNEHTIAHSLSDAGTLS